MVGNYRKLDDKNKIILLYLLVSVLGIIIFFFTWLFYPKIGSWLVMEHNFKYRFSDFFRQIVYASDLKNIYFNTTDAPFPPFAYLFFHLLWKMNPKIYEIKFSSWHLCASQTFNLFLFFLIFIIFILAFYYIIDKILKKNRKMINLLLVLSILFSAPFFAGVLERGNPAFFVLVFLLYALYLRNSKNKVFQEIALILIAISISFKIYPAVYTLLYLKQKRYQEFKRLVMYSCFLFFIPYLFTGGIQGVIAHLKIVAGFQQITPIRWTSIRCFFLSIINILQVRRLKIYVTIGLILENIFLIICVFLFYHSKSLWKSFLYLSGIMTVYVSNSFRYTSIYMIIPLIFLFKNILSNDKKIDAITFIYILLFALVYTIPIYAVKFEVDCFIFTPIYLILLISMIEDFYHMKKTKKEKNF